MKTSKHTFKASLVLDFDFTMDELDRLLAAGNEAQAREVFKEIVSIKHPGDDCIGNYNPEQVLKAGAQKMLEIRREELLQLPACADAKTATP